MKFYLTETADWSHKEKIEINSLDELLNFVDNCNSQMIVLSKRDFEEEKFFHKDCEHSDCNYKIEIYNDYRE